LLLSTGVNPAGDAGDTSPNILVWGDVSVNIHPILLRTFGYRRPILVALRSLSLKPISLGNKTPPIRVFPSHTSPHSVVRPPNLELALTSLLLSDIDVFWQFRFASLHWTNAAREVLGALL